MEIFPALVCPASWDKLLVCTDGSAEGQNAVAVTLELARACGSQVYVVQVLVPEFQAVTPNFSALLVKEVEKNLEAIKVAAAKFQVLIQPVMPENPVPHAAIVAAAEKIRPDLVIVGRRGKTALERHLMGNVTARVIGNSPANVLVVPLGAALAFQHLLVALDGSPYSEAAWKLGLAMATQAKSRVLGVAVAPQKGDLAQVKAIVQQALTAARQAGLASKAVKGVSPQGIPPDAGIVRQAIKHEVDLIIMGGYGRTGLQKLLMGSTTEKVIGTAPCPVLVVK
jgi:nucleotide-binding universal stress UspA family protein